MIFAIFLVASVLSWRSLAKYDEQPILLTELQYDALNISQANPKRIAIIGSGISGAASAYYLRRQLPIKSDFEITIFEKEPVIGGRIKSVVDFEARNIEAGADTFTMDDWCIREVINETGLSTDIPKWVSRSHDAFYVLGPWYRPVEILFLALKRVLGVYHGPLQPDQTPEIGACDSAGFTLKHGFQPFPFHLKNLWWGVRNYGISYLRLRQATLKTQKIFKQVGKSQKFSNIFEELGKAGISKTATLSAKTFLQGFGISEAMAIDIVAPLIRHYLGRTLEDSSALDMLLALSVSDRRITTQSTLFLVERLISMSSAKVLLNTAVQSVVSGTERRYKLSIFPTTLEPLEFDVVILASPFGVSRVDLSHLAINIPPVARRTNRQVTIFKSERGLSSKFFNAPKNFALPRQILFAPEEGNSVRSEIWSITSLGLYGRHDVPCSLDDECDTFIRENTYRVQSSHSLDNRTLLAMLDLTDSEEVSGLLKDCKPADGSTERFDCPPAALAWQHREDWHDSVPLFDSMKAGTGSVQLTENLYYTGSAEHVVDSMEMSCRMGRNVARLLAEPGGFFHEEELNSVSGSPEILMNTIY